MDDLNMTNGQSAAELPPEPNPASSSRCNCQPAAECRQRESPAASPHRSRGNACRVGAEEPPAEAERRESRAEAKQTKRKRTRRSRAGPKKPASRRNHRSRHRPRPGGESEETKSDKMDWFILKVQSNREESIREGLLRRVAIAGLDYYFGDIIVPTEKVTEFKGGKKKVIKRKLYPGYLVVHMEINDDTWFLVRETPGIGDFTGAAGRPSPMLPHEVSRIVAKQEEKSEKAPEAEDRLPRRRAGEDQGRHLRELRGRRGQHRRNQRTGDRDDQHLRPLDAGRVGILAN